MPYRHEDLRDAPALFSSPHPCRSVSRRGHPSGPLNAVIVETVCRDLLQQFVAEGLYPRRFVPRPAGERPTGGPPAPGAGVGPWRPAALAVPGVSAIRGRRPCHRGSWGDPRGEPGLVAAIAELTH